MMKKIQKTKKKIYEANGLFFKTKDLRDYYLELLEHKKNKLIKNFTLPTMQDKVNKNKLHAIKCTIDDFMFDSIMESKFYIYLLQAKKNNLIKSFVQQKTFLLQDSFKKNGKTYRKITYIADFVVNYNDKSIIVYDVKGKKTDVFSIKEKLFNYIYKDLPFYCVQYDKKEKT